jgi:hypothetical protein
MSYSRLENQERKFENFLVEIVHATWTYIYKCHQENCHITLIFFDE